jgi:hypothetical protein
VDDSWHFVNLVELPDRVGGRIKRPEWVELARQHKMSTVLDATADVPTGERLSG